MRLYVNSRGSVGVSFGCLGAFVYVLAAFTVLLLRMLTELLILAVKGIAWAWGQASTGTMHKRKD